MEILAGGRQSPQSIYGILKLYNLIQTLPNDTTIRIIKENNMIYLIKEEKTKYEENEIL